jgi:hypothetical protein
MLWAVETGHVRFITIRDRLASRKDKSNPDPSFIQGRLELSNNQGLVH